MAVADIGDIVVAVVVVGVFVAVVLAAGDIVVVVDIFAVFVVANAGGGVLGIFESQILFRFFLLTCANCTLQCDEKNPLKWENETERESERLLF